MRDQNGDFILHRNVLLLLVVDAAAPPDTHVVGQAQTGQQSHEQDGAHQSQFPHGELIRIWV